MRGGRVNIDDATVAMAETVLHQVRQNHDYNYAAQKCRTGCLACEADDIMRRIEQIRVAAMSGICNKEFAYECFCARRNGHEGECEL